MAKEKDKSLIRVGARQLVEAVHRTGGLSILTYHQISGQTGTRTHQAFARSLEADFLHFDVFKEYPLKFTWLANDISNDKPNDKPGESEETQTTQTSAQSTNTSTQSEQSEQSAQSAPPPQPQQKIRGIEINGRADVLMIPSQDKRAISLRHLMNDEQDEPDTPFMIEVKTVGGPLDQVPEDGEPMHWNQALLYTYLYWVEQQANGVAVPASLPYALAYVSAETLEAAFKIRHTTWEQAAEWFNGTCKAYLEAARTQEDWAAKRDLSIKQMKFPYPQVRSGQETFISRVYESIDRRTPLLAQAPTGTGKTMSTLFPAIKQLLNPDFFHIFYLTAKTSTRHVAEQALRDLRRNSGLILRSITLRAKESMCLCPELYCDTALCPYATQYYDHLPEALQALLPVQALSPDLLMEAGETHKVCPFELSLDLALYCDVIIGDYNHAFDPKVQLIRFFAPDAGQHILLIDEAHNLVDRSRDMYSATLEGSDFFVLQSLFPSDKSYAARLNQAVCDYFTELQVAMAKAEAGFDVLEGQRVDEASPDDDEVQVYVEPSEPIRVLQDENFRATNVPLRRLGELLMPWVMHMREQIDAINDNRQRRKLIEMIAQAKFFLRVQDEYWSPSYIAAVRVNKKGLAIRLICLDVSEKLSETYMNRHAAVFFSATLSPLSYFSINFCGRKQDNRPDTLLLPSPFPPENLQVLVANFLNTTYKRREESKAALAKAIALAILLKKGQQLVFFPSFAYMDLILPLLRKMLAGQEITWQIQERQMNLRARQKFLDAFSHPETGETVIGVAVLGGIFGEGIDLVGDKLTGVTIVGVGLPQLSPERNIMREYYDEMYQGGFLFAYLYPGFNKVLQAAGRLIRSEEDKGFLLLLDERYGTRSYRDLFPEEWIVEEVRDLHQLKHRLTEEQNP